MVFSLWRRDAGGRRLCVIGNVLVVRPVIREVREVERETTLCVKLSTTGALKGYFSKGKERFITLLLSNIISIKLMKIIGYKYTIQCSHRSRI